MRLGLWPIVRGDRLRFRLNVLGLRDLLGLGFRRIAVGSRLARMAIAAAVADNRRVVGRLALILVGHGFQRGRRNSCVAASRVGVAVVPRIVGLDRRLICGLAG